MQNANVFDKEEKLPITKLVKILKEANSTAFTVNFNCKVDEKQIAEKLAAATAADFKDPKALAKELLHGKETTVVGRLLSTESKLGRSLVLGLEKDNHYCLVDHRHINWLIFKNVKYIVQ